MFDPVGLSLLNGISSASVGDFSLCSGDDMDPPMSSSLLVEQFAALEGATVTGGGGGGATAGPIVVLFLGVVGSNTFSP